MSATRPLTELDFDAIKASIINFIKTDPTFTDYAFEGSALNAIADILAFNTHNTAYYANMLHNEGFIETAQKRASVVSRAKEMGYVPRSCTCSTAYIDLTVTGLNEVIPATLNRGLTLSSDNDNGSFTFSVVDDMTASIVNSDHVFTNVKIVNGTNVKNIFEVNATQNPRLMFTIPNKNIDITTLKVYVRDTFSALERTEYSRTENIYEVKADSTVFYVQESYSGEYNIYFGNDVIGKQPVDGNIIDADYFITNDLDDSVGCRLFIFSGSFGGASSVFTTTTQIAYGGSEKEDIDSIRFNALQSNSAKERAVTELDYGLILREKFSFIESASVWGGEKNTPPVYGKVFISVKPVNGFVISEATKRDILIPALKSNSIMTITPVFVEPDYLNLELTTKIKFNANKTTTNKLAIEGAVKSAVIAYVNSISQFNKDYLESTLLSTISDLDAGVVSASISKKVSVKLKPLAGIEVSHKGNLNNAVVSGSVKSTKFNILTDTIQVASIKEIPETVTITTNSFGRVDYFQSLGLYTADGVLVKSVGFINLTTGEYSLTFTLSSYLTNNQFISLQFGLVEDDIKTARNQILTLDTVTDDALIGLGSNNVVIIEPYDK